MSRAVSRDSIAHRRQAIAAKMMLPIVLFGATSVGASSEALRTTAVPEGASRVELAMDIVRDGRLTSIARLETSESVSDTLAFYREAWPADDDGPGHLEDHEGEWSILSRLDGDVLIVVQLRDTRDGVEGLMSAASITPAGGRRAEPPVLPAGGRLLSTTESRDGGRVASTAIVASGARPREVALFYRDHLTRDGWVLARDDDSDGVSVLLFDRRGAHLELVVSALPGGSVAVLNEVQDDD